MNTTLKGKRAVVTASSSGIGSGIANALAAAGADVVVNFRTSATDAEKTAAAIRQIGRKCTVIRADVTDTDDVNDLITASAKALGGIDIVVNNAGEFFFGSLMNTEVGDFKRVIDSNLVSAFASSRAALPHLIEAGGGVIVNIGLSPVDRVRGAPNVGAYAIAKTGIAVFTRTLAAEVAEFGVRVNSVSPGLIDNLSLPPEQEAWMARRVPFGRLGTIDEVAAAVLFLVSPAASYVSGTNIDVAGAWDWTNRPVDHDSIVKDLFERADAPK